MIDIGKIFICHFRTFQAGPVLRGGGGKGGKSLPWTPVTPMGAKKAILGFLLKSPPPLGKIKDQACFEVP